jgi:hypothetical protein
MKLYTLRNRRYNLDSLALIQDHLGSKLSLSPTATVGLRVPARYIREISLLSVCFLSKTVLLLGVFQLLTLTGLKPKLFLLITCYTVHLLIKICLGFQSW